MNLSEIEAKVREILSETSIDSSYYTPDNIKSFTNDGIKHMCIEGGVYEKPLTINVVDGDADYYLPLDFLSVKFLRNHKGVPLDPIESSIVGAMFIIPGKPLNYYITQKAVSLSTWIAGTNYTIFPQTCNPSSTYILPTTANGYVYECVISGTSHPLSEPNWLTVIGNRQSDASITWACRELFSSLYSLNLYDTPTALGGGVGNYTMIYSALDEGLYTSTDSPNFPLAKHHYLIPYICHRCALKAKDIPFAMAFLAEYSAGMGLSMQLPGGEGGTQS